MNTQAAPAGLSWEWAFKLAGWLLPAVLALGVALQRLEVVEGRIAKLDDVVEERSDLPPRVTAIERAHAELIAEQRRAAAEQQRMLESLAAICQATRARCR